jgi:hypothetical protein
MLSRPSLGEESTKAVICSSRRLVRGQHAIRLNAMLQAVQLPAGIAHLATGLANVDRQALSHFQSRRARKVLKIKCH